jgi:hypothetical protein
LTTPARAERRAGELLKDLQKAVGGRPSQKTGNTSRPVSPPLKDIGISKQQSSNWQRLASVPQEIFDDELKHSPRPTTSGIIKAGTAPPLPFTSTARRFPPSR